MSDVGSAAWLFTRGRDSVLISRWIDAAGTFTLVIDGPGDQTAAFHFNDVILCMNHQSEVERQLVAQGFSLEQHTVERRSGADRRLGSRGERRRGSTGTRADGESGSRGRRLRLV